MCCGFFIFRQNVIRFCQMKGIYLLFECFSDRFTRKTSKKCCGTIIEKQNRKISITFKNIIQWEKLLESI
jgi:hypothetical protein